jgi:hypothetical protein
LQHQHRIVSSLRDFLRGVRHGHAALEEQLFDVAQAQLEAEIPTHCATDDASRKTVPRKIVTDQLRSYQAAKTEIPELASVKHVFVKTAARLNKGLKTVTSPRANASVACAAFMTQNVRSCSCQASDRYGNISRSSGICCALHSIANNLQPTSLLGENSPDAPKIRRLLFDRPSSWRRSIQFSVS